MNFYPLTVASTTERIGGLAKTVVFSVPDELAATFAWQAGQHITLKLEINGEEVRRSYTISVSPEVGETLQITVKRVNGGVVSNYINDTLEPGAVIDVMPPFGGFTLEPQEAIQRTHYFIGAGSGITPLYAMINSVLSAEPHSVCHLLFANRNDTHIIFKKELERLQAESHRALTVCHVLSKPRWTSNFDYWAAGKIDSTLLEQFISEYPPYAQDTHYYICGPGNMNQTIKRDLMGLDVPAERIHCEGFGADIDVTDDSISGVPATLVVDFSSEQRTVAVAADQTLLDALRIAGVNAPYSCQSGVCGACKAQLLEGSVAMRARMALDDADITKGAILTCQALCNTGRVGIRISS